jgi:hypothetical protein
VFSLVFSLSFDSFTPYSETVMDVLMDVFSWMCSHGCVLMDAFSYAILRDCVLMDVR